MSQGLDHGLRHIISRDRIRPFAVDHDVVDADDLCGNQIYGVFVLNRSVDHHAIDATPARWRGDAGSSPLDRARTAASSPRNDFVKNYRVHPRHRLISTQDNALVFQVRRSFAGLPKAGQDAREHRSPRTLDVVVET